MGEVVESTSIVDNCSQLYPELPNKTSLLVQSCELLRSAAD